MISFCMMISDIIEKEVNASIEGTNDGRKTKGANCRG